MQKCLTEFYNGCCREWKMPEWMCVADTSQTGSRTLIHRKIKSKAVPQPKALGGSEGWKSLPLVHVPLNLCRKLSTVVSSSCAFLLDTLHACSLDTALLQRLLLQELSESLPRSSCAPKPLQLCVCHFFIPACSPCLVCWWSCGEGISHSIDSDWARIVAGTATIIKLYLYILSSYIYMLFLKYVMDIWSIRLFPTSWLLPANDYYNTYIHTYITVGFWTST